MTQLDDRLAALATRLNAKFGGDVVFQVRTSNYDKTTGKTTFGTPTPVTVKGAVVPYSKHLVAQGTVREEDANLVISAENLTFTPVVGMEVHKGSEKFVIVRATELGGETTAAWDLQLRA